MGGVYDLVLNSYGPGETIGSVHISVPDTMTMAEVHPLTKGIAVHLYKKFGINMTVGVYAENKPSVEVLEIRKAVDVLNWSIPITAPSRPTYLYQGWLAAISIATRRRTAFGKISSL